MSDIHFELSPNKLKLLDSTGHLLVIGGPGSGKTTIALLKAKRIIESGILPGRRVLFLSFARATIARVEESSKAIISNNVRKQIEINTYHGFCWKILRSHGHLLNPISPLKLLLPPDAASKLAHVPKENRVSEKKRLFEKEGLLHFDLFAALTSNLLSRSNSLTSAVCECYPYIILDEFQDTDAEQWEFIKLLGKQSTLIALGDQDQRIYEFRGADPARINHFQKHFETHTHFDFGTENNRSSGTDIVEFGNDLLTGKNRAKNYNNVRTVSYIPYTNDTHRKVKSEVLNAITRMRQSQKSNWSIALLVPTNDLMIAVSEYFTKKQIYGLRSIPEIFHEVAVDISGPSLSAFMIARLLEKGDPDTLTRTFLIYLNDHLRGRKGDTPPTKPHFAFSQFILKYLNDGTPPRKGTNNALILNEAFRIATHCSEFKFSGNPTLDWLTIRDLLESSPCLVISQVASDAKYLRLLRKGAVLNAGLSEIWRSSRTYKGAFQLVKNSLTQEYFSASSRTWSGIYLMTIHKAKGKEFDEVIVYEGSRQARFVKDPMNEKSILEARLNLRVAATRAILRATIVTPQKDPCSLLM